MAIKKGKRKSKLADVSEALENDDVGRVLSDVRNALEKTLARSINAVIALEIIGAGTDEVDQMRSICGQLEQALLFISKICTCSKRQRSSPAGHYIRQGSYSAKSTNGQIFEQLYCNIQFERKEVSYEKK